MVYDIRSPLLHLLASAAIAQQYQKAAALCDRLAAGGTAFPTDLRVRAIYQAGK